MAPPSTAFARLPVAALLICSPLLAGGGATTAAGARPATFAPAPTPALSMPPAARLDVVAGPPSQCWEALMEVKSCTGEIILYFLKGEAYLGPGCCRAIRVIERSCWAADAMMSVIGFTPEEGDILKGYCDSSDDEGNVNRSSSSPVANDNRAGAYHGGVVDDVVRESNVGSAAGRKGSVHRR